VIGPEITYRYLLPISTSSPTFEILTQAGSEAATATSVDRTLTGIPRDRILVLSSAVIVGVPGATQACTRLALTGITQAGMEFRIDITHFAAAADVLQDLNWQGEVYIPGRGDSQITLRAQATFDAGVASNSCQAAFHGIIIPRANASAW